MYSKSQITLLVVSTTTTTDPGPLNLIHRCSPTPVSNEEFLEREIPLRRNELKLLFKIFSDLDRNMIWFIRMAEIYYPSTAFDTSIGLYDTRGKSDLFTPNCNLSTKSEYKTPISRT